MTPHLSQPIACLDFSELEVVKQQKNSKIQGSVNKTGELCVVVSPNFSVQ
jgi:hypothetical protein